MKIKRIEEILKEIETFQETEILYLTEGIKSIMIKRFIEALAEKVEKELRLTVKEL